MLALVALVWADYAAAVRPGLLEVRREHHPRLYLGADNPIELIVTNRGPRVVEARLRDTPPASFRPSRLLHGGPVTPDEPTAFRYTVRPSARGRYVFGVVVLRWRTPLGLLWRQHTLPLQEDLAVYPNLVDIEKYEVLARRGLLHEMGLRASRLRGAGTEFESLREYQSDDDYRRINWKATARRQRPITTLYQTERSQRLVIMLDEGRMMLPGSGELSRLDRAVNAALLLSYVALGRGDRVGLLAFADTVTSYLPPRAGRRQFFSILEQLYNATARPVESDYATAFARLRRDLRGRSLVLLFTAPVDPDVSRLLGRHLALTARHHLPIYVALQDAELRAVASQVPDSSARLYRKLVASRVLEEQEVIFEEMTRSGVHVVDVDQEQMAAAAINRYLELKERALL